MPPFPQSAPTSLRAGMEVRRLFATLKTGVEYYMQFLVEAMSRCGHEVWLYWARSEARGRTAAVEALSHIHCRPFDWPAGWMSVGLPVHLLLDRMRLCHFPLGVIPHHCPVPALVTACDATWEKVPHLFDPPELALFRAGPGRSYQRARHLIAISECTRRDLREVYGIPDERISVVPLAPDPAMQPVPPERARAVARSHGLDGPFLLYVGSFFRWKNLPRLIQAHAVAFAGQAEAPVLALAGPPGPAAEAMMQWVSERGLSERVRHLGYVERANVAALMSAAEAFVFPSLYEGFGLPPLEAMACGAPVACSRAASLPEVVGEDALLFDPEDEGVIASALQRIVSDEALRRDLRARGPARARRFTWDRTAEGTWGVYEKVASAR